MEFLTGSLRKHSIDGKRCVSSQQQEIFDGMRSQKLKNCSEIIPKRKLHDTTQRIAGEGDKVKGAIKKIFSTLQECPRQLLRSGGSIWPLLRTRTSSII